MKKMVVVFLLVFISLSLSAQSIAIKLVYPSTITETKKNQDNKVEETIKDGGYNDFAIQLRDLLIIKLNENGIKATKEIVPETTEVVTIHVALFTTGYYIYSSIEVERFPKGSKSFSGRKLFKNKAVWVQDFTDDLSTEILNYLKQGK